MKLFDFGPAANAQRVQVFIREKGIEIPTEQLNVREGKQFLEPFTSMNPFPVSYTHLTLPTSHNV